MREILDSKKNVSKMTASMISKSTVLSMAEYEACGVEKSDQIIVSTVN
jgi:hypothetical protein